MIRVNAPRLRVPFRHRNEEVEAKDKAVLTRGQIIVIFVLFLTTFIGIMGLAIDLSYAWINELREQKAADAAALAGAVYLPDDAGAAQNASLAIAKANGYTSGVTANQDVSNPEQMDVSITGSVPTFFMRVFGVNSLTVTRGSRAQFHLPVPMGSPLSQFGYPSATDLSGHSLNFWAAIQGPCTLKQNGDPYATKDTTSVAGGSSCATETGSNTEYTGVYDYAIKVFTAGTLSIDLYDPEFCDRTAKDGTYGQIDDTGDAAFTSGSQFNTKFTLYDPSDTPYDLSDDVVHTSATYPGDNLTTAGGSCSSTYVTTASFPSVPSGTHTDYKAIGWTSYASFSAQVGTYRLRVQTFGVSGKTGDGTNEFGIRATSGGGTQPQVYAGLAGTQSAMSIYNNIPNGTSWMYLAQVNTSLAGKTMEVDLFDPGDMGCLNGTSCAATGSLAFINPDAGTYAPFRYRDSGTTLSGAGTLSGSVTSVTTSTCSSTSCHPFNGHWLVVIIQIPPGYQALNGGWWKIQYTINSTKPTDRTTWRVSIIDSPVHLVPGG